LVEAAIRRIQAATGQAVETLLAVASQGRRDGDRVRAAKALLDHALQGLAEADALHGERETGDTSAMGTADVVKLLAARLRQLDAADGSSVILTGTAFLTTIAGYPEDS
jgi:hypothetical protein